MNDAIDYSNKTIFQLHAIEANNAPGSTAWLTNKERAQAYHRAAWAERVKRQNNK